MDRNKFIIDEGINIAYIATIITNFTFQGNEYCIYTVPKKNEDSKIHIAKIINNNLEPITNEEEIKNVKIITKTLNFANQKRKGII